MKEFKFDCPACGQHIQAAEEWVGRQIECPVCKKPIFIPPPKKEAAEETAPATPAKPLQPKQPSGPAPEASAQTSATPKSPGSATPIAAQTPPESLVTSKAPAASAIPAAHAPPAGSALPAAPKPAPTAETPKSETKGEAVTVPPAEPDAPRVAVLTAAIKLAMVRSVRQRISEPSSWMPGKIDGQIAYAAKGSGEETVLVDPKSAEATRFSLIGSFLLEIHLRKVVPTAPGRRKFLDEEIPDGVREALLDEMSEEEREQTEDPLTKTDLMTISHAQCLSALLILEERYSQKMEQTRAEQARKRLGNTRLPDLVKKLEKKAQVASEDVATALYHELMDVRRRLDRLESRFAENKKSPPTTSKE